MRRVSVAIVAMSTVTDRVQLSHRCEMANERRAMSDSWVGKLQMMLLLLGLPVGREVVAVLHARQYGWNVVHRNLLVVCLSGSGVVNGLRGESAVSRSRTQLNSGQECLVRVVQDM